MLQLQGKESFFFINLEFGTLGPEIVEFVSLLRKTSRKSASDENEFELDFFFRFN